MLRFPPISQCAELAMSIGAYTHANAYSAHPASLIRVLLYVSPPEREYHSLCVKQPIGKKLFQLFCWTRPDLQNSIFLLDALVQHNNTENTF